MASCDNPVDDGIDLSGTDDDDVQTPTSGNKGKRKKKASDDGGGSSRSKKLKTRSWVWDHFTKLEKDNDKCNCHYCGKVLSCPSKSGTSTLKKHIEHTCKAYKVCQSANKNKSQTVLTPDGAGGSLKAIKVSEAVFREASNEMLVIGKLPLAFIECLAWRHFCSKVQLYKPHSRRTATRDIVELYVKKKKAMKKIIGHNKQRLSLTIDIWVSTTTGASYMVITAHFVDAMWQLRKMIIGFKNVDDHKGSTICKVLLECLAEWDIKRIFCITVDNATANSNALTKFKTSMKQIGDDALILKGDYMHLRCATHILNLIVREWLHEIDHSVSAIRNGINFVRSSTNRLKSFDLRVETGRLQRGSLPLDVKTRWNSTFLMLEQALKFRLAFEKMVEEDKPFNDYFLENVEGKKRIGPALQTDWDEVDRLVQILDIFYKSTMVLSASTSVASHKLYNEIVSITKNLSGLSSVLEPDKELQKKALSMLSKLSKYWDLFGEKVEMNRMVIVACVFDPRKKMKFAQLCFDTLYGKNSVESSHLCDEVYQIMKDLYDEYSRASLLNKNGSGTGGSMSSSQSQDGWSQSQSQDQVGSDSCERTCLGRRFQFDNMEIFFDEIVKEAGIQSSSNELDSYLKDTVETPIIPKGTEYDVLSFWKINSGRYPILSLIAKDIFAMQVSSVASESAFSTSGRVLSPYRSCLTHYMIEVLMCTEQWLKCKIQINEKEVSTNSQLLSEVEHEDDLMREFEPEFQHAGGL